MSLEEFDRASNIRSASAGATTEDLMWLIEWTGDIGCQECGMDAVAVELVQRLRLLEKVA